MRYTVACIYKRLFLTARPRNIGRIMALCCYWNNHKGKMQDFCALLFKLITNKRDHVSVITVLKHAQTLSNLFPYRLTVEVRLYLTVSIWSRNENFDTAV